MTHYDRSTFLLVYENQSNSNPLLVNELICDMCTAFNLYCKVRCFIVSKLNVCHVLFVLNIYIILYCFKRSKPSINKKRKIMEQRHCSLQALYITLGVLVLPSEWLLL